MGGRCANIQARIVIFHQNARDIWLVTCREIGLVGQSLATSNRWVAERQANLLVEKVQNPVRHGTPRHVERCSRFVRTYEKLARFKTEEILAVDAN